MHIPFLKHYILFFQKSVSDFTLSFSNCNTLEETSLLHTSF